MSYYNFYQTHQPQYWGTPQYQFPQPPLVTYQPQPSWGAYDYYNAHSSWGRTSPDSSVFDYALSKVKSFMGFGGLATEEAEFWHRRVYGGMIDVTTILPADLGGAAAYEAMRYFDSQQGTFRFSLNQDSEGEKDAVMGLAIAEATKLWGYTGRLGDKYGRREACEVAAATARRLYRDRYGYDDYGGFGFRRRGSFSRAYDDDYDGYSSSRRPGMYRRRSSSSYLNRPAAQALIAAQPYVAGNQALALTIPTSSYGYGSGYGSGYANGYGGGYGSYPYTYAPTYGSYQGRYY